MRRDRMILVAAVLVAALSGFFLRDQVLGLLQRVRPAPAADNATLPDTTIVRPLTGTLHIRVPAAALGADYWVYVNERLVSEPPHDLQALRSGSSFRGRLSDDGYIWEDDKGIALKVHGDQVLFVRDDVKADDHVFQDVSLPIAPGHYEVVLMTRTTDSSESFPFSFVRGEADVAAGGSTEVVMSVPKAPNAGSVIGPPRAALVCANELPGWLEDGQRRYLADPLTHPLQEVYQTFASNPPQQPAAIIDLPPRWGGAREYSAAQVDDMVTSLELRYANRMDESFKSDCRSRMGAGFDNLASFSDEIDQRIAGLHDIARKLRDAGGAPGAR